MRALKLGLAALVAVLGLVGAGVATAEGPNAIITSGGCQSTSLPRNDDGSSSQVQLPFTVNFFGSSYNSLYVNNNGNVTFNSAMSTYTPFGLTGTTRIPVIAPFFADVDTRGTASDIVRYGEISAGSTEVNGHPAFCVNWVNVGYYAGHTDKLNSFQLVLIDRSETGAGNFDIEFNYDKIQWETGDASGGNNGFGGQSAHAGYTDGFTAAGSFEIPGSGVNGALLDANAATGLVNNSINSPFQLGRYVFPVRAGGATGSALSGHVWQNAAGTPLPGAFIQACPSPAGPTCRNATTNAAGFYIFTNLPDHTTASGAPDYDWNLVVYPPSGSGLGTGTAGPIPVQGLDVNNVDVVLHGPQPLPAGASLSTPSRGTATSGVPTVYWGDPMTLAFVGCAGGTGTATLTVEDGYTVTVPLTGQYTATFPPPYPHHGQATITFTTSCGTAGAFDLYIDPSGIVVDSAGHPVEGATVTLLRSDDPAGPFVAVPNGSAIMSPANRQNPDLTGETGHFGWDVLAGYYKVRAERADCTGGPVESAVMQIPPPVTDLRLVLEGCPIGDTTPPEIAAHDDVTAEATSSAGALVTYEAPTATDDTDGSVPVTCAPASGSAFALGDTLVECSATDAAGNEGTSSFAVHVVDTTAPTIAAHADIVVDATSAAGAAVGYTAPTASDLVDGSVAVSCSPASGSTFHIGTTTVTCTAADHHGSSTSSNFRVTVTGALGQLQALLAWSIGVGPGTSIADKIREAIADLGTSEVCGDLKALDNEARAQTGKKLNAAQASRIRGDVARIRAVLGCG